MIVGIDNAGKSTTLEQLKLKYTGKGMDLAKIPPTIGLNSMFLLLRKFYILVGRFQVDGVVAICWDVGGQLNLRQLWSNYFEEVDGIIFVMDSSDRARFDESFAALKTVLDNSSLKGKPLLFLANKSDITDASSLEEISPIFNFNTISGRPFLSLACSAKSDIGLEEGIRWIVSEAVKFNSAKMISSNSN